MEQLSEFILNNLILFAALLGVMVMLIKAELDYFMVFARKLHDIASKGVHAEVTVIEAKQGFVGLYLFLSNLIQKLQLENS